jgi:A1 cistron-splicing factor AAR2
VKRLEFDKNLGAYALESLPQWSYLTTHVASSTIDRLQSGTNVITSVPEAPSQEKIDRLFSNLEVKDADEQKYTTKTSGHPEDTIFGVGREGDYLQKFQEGIPMENEDEEMADASEGQFPLERPDLSNFEEPKSDIPWMDITHNTKLPNVTPERLTEVNFDKSFQFLNLVERFGGLLEVISEFEASFVMFSLGQSYEGFEQWKKFVALLCRCDSAIRSEKYKNFFREDFPTVLYHQLVEVPEDYFEDIVTGNNFLVASLKVCLRDFFF